MDSVPVRESLPSTDRYERMRIEFKRVYSKEPSFFVRAPGRVNLIGEHIDYCGYSVLPMAIEQDCIIAISHNTDTRLRLNNINSETYNPVDLDPHSLDIDKVNPKWQHYIVCGYRGSLEHLREEAKHCGFGGHCGAGPQFLSGGGVVGLDMLVDGNIPRSAGLSSSSALVCASALATMFAVLSDSGAGKQINKTQLAEICQHCERYIGTEGGGMDQSISFLAQRGTAKLIDFNPIRATDVRLPAGAVFVISNSCVESNKAATDHFNIRVAECRLATQVLAKQLHVAGDTASLKRLGELPARLPSGAPSLVDMVDIVKRTLHEEPYSKDEICSLLGLSIEQLNADWLSERSRHVDSFRLHQRALHVYSEADRVYKFKDVCDKASDRDFVIGGGGRNDVNEVSEGAGEGGQDVGSLDSLGRLMYESHISCRDLYECSCTELDTLVELAMSSGALGSRLTGAGWGGCAVSLVHSDKLVSFLSKLQAGYYENDESRRERLSESLFATEPGDGAAVYLCA